MPKIKKTRKQKLLSDQRHLPQTNQYSLPQAAITPHAPQARLVKSKPTSINTQEYVYLSKDLWKTIILTSLIIIAEIFIKQFTV